MEIDLTDCYSLLAVWELKAQNWELLTITRLRCANALSHKPNRLVFPPAINPNRVWGKRSPASVDIEQFPKRVSNQKRLLELVEIFPAQSSTFLAEEIGLAVATVISHLRSLEKEDKIHHRPSPSDNRIRLYYPGRKPSHIGLKATANACKTALPKMARQEPSLKVYFVDPRTLQGVNK